jgi:hypothetical protein
MELNIVVPALFEGPNLEELFPGRNREVEPSRFPTRSSW